MRKVEVWPELYYVYDACMYYVISKSGAVYCTGYSRRWNHSIRDVDKVKMRDVVLKHIKMRWIHVDE